MYNTRIVFIHVYAHRVVDVIWRDRKMTKAQHTYVGRLSCFLGRKPIIIRMARKIYIFSDFRFE